MKILTLTDFTDDTPTYIVAEKITILRPIKTASGLASHVFCGQLAAKVKEDPSDIMRSAGAVVVDVIQEPDDVPF